MDELIKQAFSKAKEDILNLGQEMSNLKLDVLDIKKDLALIKKEFDRFLTEKLEKEVKIPYFQIPAYQQITPAIQQITPAHHYPLKALKSQNLPISIGNEGVPTNKQTDRQTDQQIIQHIPKEQKIQEEAINNLEKASEILSSLDNLKKELRIKIKRLTPQEMKIFSIVYQIHTEGKQVDYPLLAGKTSLSQSSIRDYIQRIINKGIPINKEKIDNKRVILHISQDFTKIASLDTILKLREL